MNNQDINSEQLAVWLALTTRHELRNKLLKPSPTPADVIALKEAGIDPASPSSQTFVAAVKDHATAFAQINGVFHSAMLTLNGTYPPPDCPKSGQILAVSKL